MLTILGAAVLFSVYKLLKQDWDVVTLLNFAKVACPVDRGLLRQSITSRVDAQNGRVVGTIDTPIVYARYLHEGTGIYGPRHAYIYPRRGRFLVFETKGVFGPLRRGAKRKPKGRRNVVFARRVRGIPPNPFLVRGLERAMPGIPINYHL